MNLYDKYDYNNYQLNVCNQPLQIRNLLYRHVNKDKSLHVLSVGCGTGYIEKFLVDSGHYVDGYELSQKACDIARKNGINCKIQDILTAIILKKYDWIILIDIWEHIVDTEKLLSQVYSLLKPEGMVFLKSPNFGHLKFRLHYLIMGSLDTSYQLSVGHCSHYTYYETLNILSKTKFKIAKKYCFTYNPKPFVFHYQSYYFPNITSLSTILILEK